MFLLPTLGPDTTSGDEDVAIHPIATRTLVFHRRIPCVPVGSFRGKHVLLRRAQPCQLRSVKPHGGFITKFCSVRRPCRRQCGSPVEKNGLQD